jgi:hypothetical protein
VGSVEGRDSYGQAATKTRYVNSRIVSTVEMEPADNSGECGVYGSGWHLGLIADARIPYTGQEPAHTRPAFRPRGATPVACGRMLPSRAGSMAATGSSGSPQGGCSSQWLTYIPAGVTRFDTGRRSASSPEALRQQFCQLLQKLKPTHPWA